MTNTRNALPLAVLCLLAGCVSSPTGSPAGAHPAARPYVRIATDRGSAEVTLSDADVNRFASRLASHAARGRAACARELVRDMPDLALEAFRRPVGRVDAESVALRSAIATAWEEAFGEAALRESECARRANPDEAARAVDLLLEGLAPRADGTKLVEASLAFEAMGDAFWSEECRRLASVRGASAAPAMPRTSAQSALRALESARSAILARRWAEARAALPSLMDSAIKRRDLALAAGIEELRAQPEIAAAFGVEETRRWLTGLGSLALDRNLPLLALRCAMSARDAAPAGIDSEGRDAARRLFARASTARGDLPLAFRVAEGLLDEARAANRPADEVAAASLCADILLAEGRAKEAAGMFMHAAGVADALSMTAEAARSRLGAAGALLSAGMLAPCARELEKAPVSGVTGRRTRFASALLAAAARETASARDRLCALIIDAETAGDYSLLEHCESAKERLE